MPTIAAAETIWPFHFGQVVSAGLFGVKAIIKLDLASGKTFCDKER